MAQATLSKLTAKLGLGKKALLLGAGFVVKPTVQILTENGVSVTVGCRTLKSAQELCSGFANTRAIIVDASNTEALVEALQGMDIVISLIPYTQHANVIKAAIQTKTNVVTTSYVSPAMLALEDEVKNAGITVMNEIGLDPGIDHLYAVKTIDEVHEKEGKIVSFLSYCGGLPAPEASDNPLGYKFSWSSRGVLLALLNTAEFFKDGERVKIPGDELMGSAKPYHIYPGYNFVAYANRDSTPFREKYSIPEAQTIIRGTLRYAGFPEFVRALVDLGFFSEKQIGVLQPSSSPPTLAESTAAIIGASSPLESDLVSAISSKATFNSDEEQQRVLVGMKWLGLLSSDPATPRGTPIDTLCARLEQRMQYEEGERDFVMLQHKFGIEWKDGTKETRTSTLVEYGEPQRSGSTSAMAKLVGTPCAVAVLQVLDGTISEKGILAPLNAKIASPLIKVLREQYGIEMKEKTVLS